MKRFRGKIQSLLRTVSLGRCLLSLYQNTDDGSTDPIIFRGLKSITQSNSQTNTLLRLAQEGISVYCPHTAVDAAPGGLNDWLCDIFSGLGPSE